MNNVWCIFALSLGNIVWFLGVIKSGGGIAGHVDMGQLTNLEKGS